MVQYLIFNQWLKNFDNILTYCIFARRNSLIGNFHLFNKRKFGLIIYRNPPFTSFIGTFIKIDTQNPSRVINKHKEVASLMANFLDKLNYSIISVTLERNIVDALPFIWKKFKVIPDYTYILDLNKTLDDLNKGMSGERRNINKDIRDKLTVKKIDNFSIVKSLVLKTSSRQGKVVNEFYLDKIPFDFAKDSNSFSFATFKEDDPIAVTFCVYDKKTAYYLSGGYDYESKHRGAGALAMLKAIKYSKKNGLRYSDFEGSMIPQIERYFRGFGGGLTPYFRVNKAFLPFEMLLKFYKRELF